MWCESVIPKIILTALTACPYVRISVCSWRNYDKSTYGNFKSRHYECTDIHKDKNATGEGINGVNYLNQGPTLSSCPEFVYCELVGLLANLRAIARRRAVWRISLSFLSPLASPPHYFRNHPSMTSSKFQVFRPPPPCHCHYHANYPYLSAFSATTSPLPKWSSHVDGPLP